MKDLTDVKNALDRVKENREIMSLISPECETYLWCSDTEEHGSRPYCPKCDKIIVEAEVS